MDKDQATYPGELVAARAEADRVHPRVARELGQVRRERELVAKGRTRSHVLSNEDEHTSHTGAIEDLLSMPRTKPEKTRTTLSVPPTARRTLLGCQSSVVTVLVEVRTIDIRRNGGRGRTSQCSP